MHDRYLKRSAVALALLLAAAIGTAQGAGLSFTWAFARRAADGRAIPIDFSSRVDLAPGDLFKILVQPAAGSWVYLLLQDSTEALELLFPPSFSLFDKASYAKSGYFIPEGEDWFTLDGAKGTERFHLLASSERLRPLESLVLAYQKASPGGDAGSVEAKRTRQAILDEVRRLIKEHSQLTAAAEKPVTIAGGSRGINESVARIATRIEAGGFYSRTFRLEH